MRKIVLSLAVLVSLASASESIIGEFGAPTKHQVSGISLDAGLWYMTWDQTSTASDMLQNSSDALDSTSTIDSAIATAVKLNMNYPYVSANAEYYNGNDIDSFNLDFTLLKLIPFINIEFRYVQSNFNGYFFTKPSTITTQQALDTNQYADGKFESPLKIIDIIIYPFNEYFGLGYRNYDYEVPQDFYLIDNTTNALATTTNAPNSGAVDIKYKGSFFTLVADNKKLVQAKSDYNGLIYSAIIGYGKLSPSSLTNEYVTLSDAQYLNTFVSDNDATFYDISFGYSYKHKSDDGFGYGLGAGYRYNKIETTANKASNSEGYSLITEFNTEFHGPFIDLTISY